MRFIYPNVMTLIGWSMLINDVKGEMFDKTAAHRRASGNIVIRLDPFNVCGPGSDSFNPIAALPIDDNLPDDAMELAEALIRISGNDTHWSEAAQELVCGLILYVRLVIPNGSLIDVRRLLGLDFIGWKRLIRGGYNTDPRQYELWEKTPEKDRDPDYEPPFKYRRQALSRRDRSFDPAWLAGDGHQACPLWKHHPGKQGDAICDQHSSHPNPRPR